MEELSYIFLSEIHLLSLGIVHVAGNLTHKKSYQWFDGPSAFIHLTITRLYGTV